MKEKKKVHALPIAKGTILYGSCQYKGIIVEYRLNQYQQEYFELFIYPKLLDLTLDYSLGLTLKVGEISRMEQKSWLQNRVIKHLPSLTRHGYEGKKEICTINVCDHIKHLVADEQLATTSTAFKLKFKIQKLDSLDFWILPCPPTGNISLKQNSEYQLIKIPNLVHFKIPNDGVSFTQAYPKFDQSSSGQWWLNCREELTADIIHPKIDWGDVYKEDLVTKNSLELMQMMEMTEYPDQSNEAYRNLFHNLKMLELQISGVNLKTGVDTNGRLGNWLSLHNGGPAVAIAILVNSRLVDSLLVPEGEVNFNYFIPNTDNIQVRLLNSQGPVLIENIITEHTVKVSYLEMGDGIWIQMTNCLREKEVVTLIEIVLKERVVNKLINPISPEGQQKKFMPNKYQEPYTFRVYLLDGETKRLISEYLTDSARKYFSQYMPAINNLNELINEEDEVEQEDVEQEDVEQEDVEEEDEVEEEDVEEDEVEEDDVDDENDIDEDVEEDVEEEDIDEQEDDEDDIDEDDIGEDIEEDVEEEEDVVEQDEDDVDEQESKNDEVAFIPFSSQPYIKPLEPVEQENKRPNKQSLVMEEDDDEDSDREPTHSEIERMIDQSDFGVLPAESDDEESDIHSSDFSDIAIKPQQTIQLRCPLIKENHEYKKLSLKRKEEDDKPKLKLAPKINIKTNTGINKNKLINKGKPTINLQKKTLTLSVKN